MKLNADFARRASVHAAALPWIGSPTPGIDRRMLDRIGEEVARATSLVRYAPASAFPRHVHGGGEEFFVLDGVFSDERGDYPAGTYVRNPPGSSHSPGSVPGCIIFVKLWQFAADDRLPLRIETADLSWSGTQNGPDVEAMILYRRLGETVQLEQWRAGRDILRSAADGLELLVLEGGFSEGGENFVAQSWLRLPRGASVRARVGTSGCRLWVKSGHLARPVGVPGRV